MSRCKIIILTGCCKGNCSKATDDESDVEEYQESTDDEKEEEEMTRIDKVKSYLKSFHCI